MQVCLSAHKSVNDGLALHDFFRIHQHSQATGCVTFLHTTCSNI